MDGYQIKAYAKINLGLDVVRRLPNGYHEVKMVMQSVGLWDELTLERAEDGITITTDADGLSTGEDNLIYRAARLMLDKYGCPGLGGTELAEGIGEKLTPLPPLPPCHILIAKPDISVSTKYVYEHLDAGGLEAHPDIDGMVQAIRDGSLRGVLERMANVLETVTVPAHPVIADIKARMRELGAADSLMSGSGPTVFGIFRQEDRKLAEAALEQFGQEDLAGQAFLTTPV